jgi:hypothetical protein
MEARPGAEGAVSLALRCGTPPSRFRRLLLRLKPWRERPCGDFFLDEPPTPDSSFESLGDQGPTRPAGVSRSTCRRRPGRGVSCCEPSCRDEPSARAEQACETGPGCTSEKRDLERFAGKCTQAGSRSSVPAGCEAVRSGPYRECTSHEVAVPPRACRSGAGTLAGGRRRATVRG